MSEKAMNQMRLLSQPPYGEMQFQVQLLQIHTRQIAHFNVFQVMPAPLVPRAQIRGIARQAFDVKRLRRTTRQVVRNGAPAVNRRTIPDHQQTLPRLTPQMLQEKYRM